MQQVVDAAKAPFRTDGAGFGGRRERLAGTPRVISQPQKRSSEGQEPPSELLTLTAARDLPMAQVGGGQHDARRRLALGNRPARTAATWMPASAATRMSDQTMGAILAGDVRKPFPWTGR
jgi:hypothetical protein